MLRQTAVFVALGFGGLALSGQQSPRPEFHAHRAAASDLEVSGLLKRVPSGETRFVSRAFIASLPQVAVTMKHNEDFPEMRRSGVAVGGVYLDVLAKALGVSEDGLAIEAVCKDGYTATFPFEYLRLHHPIFVTTIGGLSLHRWAMKHHDYDAGPYLIGYEDFQPAFQVLSHTDRPQEPAEIQRLGFYTETSIYAGIAPRDPAPSTDVAAGYRIARQNCYRCHNAAGHGGNKAGKSWTDLGDMAKNRPEKFERWVENPQAVDQKSKMPPNPEYDRATLKALQRYFSTFAAEGQ